MPTATLAQAASSKAAETVHRPSLAQLPMEGNIDAEFIVLAGKVFLKAKSSRMSAKIK